jgi:uncharacterized protein YegP (UPF0339 family)
MSTTPVRLLYKRADGKWAWHLSVGGKIIATDGSQGYENENDARTIADRVVDGYYSDAERQIRK